MPHYEARFQEIETKISFQEHLLEGLNEALKDQQQQLDGMRQDMARIRQLLETQDEQEKDPGDEAPPPHY